MYNRQVSVSCEEGIIGATMEQGTEIKETECNEENIFKTNVCEAEGKKKNHASDSTILKDTEDNKNYDFTVNKFEDKRADADPPPGHTEIQKQPVVRPRRLVPDQKVHPALWNSLQATKGLPGEVGLPPATLLEGRHPPKGVGHKLPLHLKGSQSPGAGEHPLAPYLQEGQNSGEAGKPLAVEQ